MICIVLAYSIYLYLSSCVEFSDIVDQKTQLVSSFTVSSASNIVDMIQRELPFLISKEQQRPEKVHEK